MIDAVTIALGAAALFGALMAVFTREVARLGLGVGLFLLSVAGLFAVRGFAFLAVGELFLYVGGVLVLLLFALLLVHRGKSSGSALESRHDPLAAVAAAGLGAFIFAFARPVLDSSSDAKWTLADVGERMLGKQALQFELAGLLLLAALVAVVLISGEERR